ncbi:MAG: hypothetical protein KBT11_07120 [Treponema sp.]|nr:hypothetical protein [Candidatus Treponema equifaecale]
MFFDDGDADGFKSHENDELEYYFDFIASLADSGVSKREILQEMLDELDLEQDEAVKIIKKYFAAKEEAGDDDDEESDYVEDDDYGDGNSER